MAESNANVRANIYLEPALHRAIRLKAAHTDRSISDLVNEAVRELVFKRSVAKDLRELPKKDVARILRRITALAKDPSADGCEKLSRLERYRIQQGNYRIVYEIQDQRLIVLIGKVGHRKGVYKH